MDCQHTLWNVPIAKNSKEYIEFLEKRFINKYLTNYANTIYCNYDLGETLKKPFQSLLFRKRSMPRKNTKWITYSADL